MSLTDARRHQFKRAFSDIDSPQYWDPKCAARSHHHKTCASLPHLEEPIIKESRDSPSDNEGRVPTGLRGLLAHNTQLQTERSQILAQLNYLQAEKRTLQIAEGNMRKSRARLQKRCAIAETARDYFRKKAAAAWDPIPTREAFRLQSRLLDLERTYQRLESRYEDIIGEVGKASMIPTGLGMSKANATAEFNTNSIASGPTNNKETANVLSVSQSPEADRAVDGNVAPMIEANSHRAKDEANSKIEEAITGFPLMAWSIGLSIGVLIIEIYSHTKETLADKWQRGKQWLGMGITQKPREKERKNKTSLKSTSLSGNIPETTEDVDEQAEQRFLDECKRDEEERSEYHSEIYDRAVEEALIAARAMMNAETEDEKRFAERARIRAEQTKALLDPLWQGTIDYEVKLSLTEGV